MRLQRPRFKFLALALAATVTGVTAGAAVANVAATGCQVTYAVGSQRAGGFTGNVGITNFGDPLTSWTVRWSFTAGQSVTQAWNA